MKEFKKINLQLFAEGDAPPADGGTNTPPAGDATPPKTFTQEEFQKALQSESDKRVSEALKTAQAKLEVDFKAKLETEKAEAEKLLKMNTEEKHKHEMEKIKAQLESITKDKSRMELKDQTLKIMAEKQIPIEFVEMVMADDAEKVNANLDSVKKVFDVAVQKAVDERLKGTPPKGGGAPGSLTFEQRLTDARKNNNLAEQMRVIDEAAREGKTLI